MAPPTGLPVPRFVSLRSAEVNVRTGPGTRYPVEWVFVKRDIPVEITAEFDTWRRIRDWEGTEGWVHQSMLSGKRAIWCWAMCAPCAGRGRERRRASQGRAGGRRQAAALPDQLVRGQCRRLSRLASEVGVLGRLSGGNRRVTARGRTLPVREWQGAADSRRLSLQSFRFIGMKSRDHAVEPVWSRGLVMSIYHNIFML